MVGDSKDIEEIRRRTQARVEAEKAFYASPRPRQEITPSFVLQCLDANEVGDAALFVAIHRERLVFDHAEGSWFTWTGHHWKRDGMRCALAAVNEVVEEYAKAAASHAMARADAAKSGDKSRAEAAERQEAEFCKRIRGLQSLKRREHVLELATAGTDSLAISGDEWDTDPWLLGCPNGVVDLRTGELRDGRPGDFIQTAVPTPYDPRAEAPTWEAFLSSILDGDADLAGYFKRLLGYAITGLTTEHILPVLWGQGRNGKGTMFDNALHPVLGSISGPIQSEMLLDQGRVRSSAGPSPDIMDLKGRRLVWASETSQSAKLDSARAKLLSGGDELAGRWPHSKRPIHFKPTHTLFLLTNRKPHAPADDYALWRRMHLIPFTLSFVDNPLERFERPKDGELPEKLSRERPGILRWLIEGCLEWQRDGLAPPRRVLEATREYRNEEDIIGHFIEERCVKEERAQAKAAELYEAYCEWAKENGHRPMSSKSFGSQLVKDYRRGKSNGATKYYGLGLVSEQ